MLAPVKAEQLHADPQVWLYHGVVSTEETDKMIEVSRNKVIFNMSIFCPNPNDNTAQPTTQPQHCSLVGHENDFANPTPPTTETQGRPSGASD